MRNQILGNLAAVKSDTPAADPPSRGRPRNAESTKAILQAAAYSDHVFCTVRHRLRELVARVVGEDDPDLDARADLGPALLLYRAQVLRQLDDPDAASDEAA